MQPAAGRRRQTPAAPNKAKKQRQAAVNGNGNGHSKPPQSQLPVPDVDDDDNDDDDGDFAFQSPPTFLQSLFHPDIASRWRTLVHVRRFEISSLPVGEAELKAWLEERWVEKGELLEELRGKLERGEDWGEDRKGK